MKPVKEAKYLEISLIALLVLVLFYNFVTALEVDFVGDTPDNGTSFPTLDFIFVNLSTNDSNDHYAFVDFDSDVLLWMMMDEVNSSGDPYDNSSYGNDGATKDGAAQTASGYFGDGFEFDGDGDYIYVPPSSSLDSFGNNLTVSLWSYTEEDASTLSNNKQRGFFHMRKNVTERIACYYNYYDASADRINCYNDIDNVGESEALTGCTPINDTWVHYVFVFNATTLVVYENGVSCDDEILDANLSKLDDGFYLNVGKSFGGDSSVWNGTLDDFIIFNRSLNENEILSLYNASAYQYYHNFTGLADGEHLFTGYMVNKSGEVNQTEQYSVSTGPDSIAPDIIIATITNERYYSSSSIDLNISSTASDVAQWWYSNSSGESNSSFYDFGTNASVTWDEGENNLTVWMNDTSTNVNSTNISFVVDTIFPEINFTSPTPSSGESVTSIIVNITTNDTNSDYAFIDFNNSLVGWWRMEEFNDTTFFDNSTYKHHASIVANANQTNSGFIGKGLELDGNGDYLSVNGIVDKFNKTDFTLLTWVNFNDIQNKNPLIGGRSGNYGFTFNYKVGAVDKIYLILGNGTDLKTLAITPDETINTDTWYHFAVVFKKGWVYFYLNGNEDTEKRSVGDWFLPVSDNDGIMEIGAESQYTSLEINGTMDEIVLFSRALDSDEISALYNFTADSLSRKYIEQDIGSKNFTAYVVDKAGNMNSTEVRNLTAQTSAIEFLGVNYTFNDSTFVTLSVSTTYGIYNLSNLYNNSDLTVSAQYRVDDGAWTDMDDVEYVKEFNASEWSGAFGDSITGTGGNWLREFESLAGSWIFASGLQRGVGGDRCFQIWEDIISLAENNTKLFLQCGINDIITVNPSSDADIKSNFTAIFADLRTKDISIYFQNVLPNEDEDVCENITSINSWLLDYYNNNNSDGLILGFADIYSVLKNSNNCTFNASLTNDGTHPNDAGKRIYGQTVFEEAFKYKYFDGHFANLTATSNGEYDLRWVITTPAGVSDNYTLNNLFNVSGILSTETPTPTDGTPSGSSGGDTSQSSVTEVVQTYSGSEYLLERLGTGTIDFKTNDPYLSITSITLQSNRVVSNVKISIKEIYRPDLDIPFRAYEFFEISKENLEDNWLNDVVINFKFNKYKNVILYRYTNKWDELEIKKVNEDAYFNYYEANSPGLSYFAIGERVERKALVPSYSIKEKIKKIIHILQERKISKKDKLLFGILPLFVVSIFAYLLFLPFLHIIRKKLLYNHRHIFLYFSVFFFSLVVTLLSWLYFSYDEFFFGILPLVYVFLFLVFMLYLFSRLFRRKKRVPKKKSVKKK